MASSQENLGYDPRTTVENFTWWTWAIFEKKEYIFESLYGVCEHCSGWFAHLLDQFWQLVLFLKMPLSIRFGQLNAANRALKACILNIHGCLKVFGLPLNQSFFCEFEGVISHSGHDKSWYFSRTTQRRCNVEALLDSYKLYEAVHKSSF